MDFVKLTSLPIDIGAMTIAGVKRKKRGIFLILIFFINVCFCTYLLFSCGSINDHRDNRHRVLISSDIGGTDPDDFQSFIHLLMYAEQFELEGLISSPFGPGRMDDFKKIIAVYEKDYARLINHVPDLPKPQDLVSICKQGAVDPAPYNGYSQSTEGSEWIVNCARRKREQPLWILVWGGLEDLAQALYDAPDIKQNLRVYWIGGPNKKWSVNAYSYIAENHADLWMIEANSTYRGWFMDQHSPEHLKGERYYDAHVAQQSALGAEFKRHYNGNIKMGDTPSLAYLMNGCPEDALGESWGGSFVPINRSTRYRFDGNSTISDTVDAYGVMEWQFIGPVQNVVDDSVYFTMEIAGQVWPGYYVGTNRYAIRYSSKKPEKGSYVTSSKIPELDQLTGSYVSTVPWPSRKTTDDYILGDNWYSDDPDASLFIKDQQGAMTVAKHREEYLTDWASRWRWLW